MTTKQNQIQNDHDDFDTTPVVEVSTATLDAKVREVQEAREDADKKKAVYSEANKKADGLEAELIALMQSCKKSSYKVDGVGTVSVYDKYSVKVPADGESKDAFFAFVEEKYGKDGLDKYRTVNSAALNSLFNQLVEEEGIVEMPGVGLPTPRTVLSITSARGKRK